MIRRLAASSTTEACRGEQDAQWEQSERSFRRAIELDPSGSESHLHFAAILLPLGRIEEALKQLHLGEKTDPLSPRIHFNLAWVLISAGRYDEAFGYCEKLPADFWSKSSCLGRARFWQGRIGEAIQILATANDRGSVPDIPSLPYIYVRAGRREEAEKLAADLSPLQPLKQAAIFAGLGDKDRTLEALDRSAGLGPLRIGAVLTYPEFALLRGDPRVKALHKKVGLPE